MRVIETEGEGDDTDQLFYDPPIAAPAAHSGTPVLIPLRRSPRPTKKIRMLNVLSLGDIEYAKSIQNVIIEELKQSAVAKKSFALSKTKGITADKKTAAHKKVIVAKKAAQKAEEKVGSIWSSVAGTPSPPVGAIMSPLNNLETRLKKDIAPDALAKFIKRLIILDSLHDFDKSRKNYNYNNKMRKYIANTYCSKVIPAPAIADYTTTDPGNSDAMEADLNMLNIILSDLEKSIVPYLIGTLPSILSDPVRIRLEQIETRLNKIDKSIYDKQSVSIDVGASKDANNLHIFIDKFLLGNIAAPMLYLNIDGYPNTIVTNTLEKFKSDTRQYNQILTPQNVFDSSTSSTSHFKSADRITFIKDDQILTRSDINIGYYNYDIKRKPGTNPILSGLHTWCNVDVIPKDAAAAGAGAGSPPPVATLSLDSFHRNGTSVASIGSYVKNVLDTVISDDTNDFTAAQKTAISKKINEVELGMDSLLLGPILKQISKTQRYIETLLDQKYGGDSGQYNAVYHLNMKGIPTIFATMDTYAAHMAALQGIPTILGLPSSIILFKGTNYTPNNKEQYKNIIFRSIAKINTIFLQINYITSLNLSRSTLYKLIKNIKDNIDGWIFADRRWINLKSWHELLIKLKALDIASYLIKKHNEIAALKGEITVLQESIEGAILGAAVDRSDGYNIIITDATLDALTEEQLRALADVLKTKTNKLDTLISNAKIDGTPVIKYKEIAESNKFIFGEKPVEFFKEGSTINKLSSLNYDIEILLNSEYARPVDIYMKSEATPFSTCEFAIDKYLNTFINAEFSNILPGGASHISNIKTAIMNRNIGQLTGVYDTIRPTIMASISALFSEADSAAAGAAGADAMLLEGHGGYHGGMTLTAAAAPPAVAPLPKGKFPAGSYKPTQIKKQGPKTQSQPAQEEPTAYAKSVLEIMKGIAECFTTIKEQFPQIKLEAYTIPADNDFYTPNHAAIQNDMITTAFHTILQGAYNIDRNIPEVVESVYAEYKNKWLDMIDELEAQVDSEERAKICEPLTAYFRNETKGAEKPLLDVLAYIYYVAQVDRRIYRLYKKKGAEDGIINVFGMNFTQDTAAVTESNIGEYIKTIASAAKNADDAAHAAEMLSIDTGLERAVYIPEGLPILINPITGDITPEGEEIFKRADAGQNIEDILRGIGMAPTNTYGVDKAMRALFGNKKKSRKNQINHAKAVLGLTKKGGAKRRITRKKWSGNKRASRKKA